MSCVSQQGLLCREIVGFAVVEFCGADGVPVNRPASVGTDRPDRAVCRRDRDLGCQRDMVGKDMVGVAASEKANRPAVGALKLQVVLTLSGIGKQAVGLYLQAVLVACEAGGKERVTDGRAVEGDAVDADAGCGKRQVGFGSVQPKGAGKDGAGAFPGFLRGTDPLYVFKHGVSSFLE